MNEFHYLFFNYIAPCVALLSYWIYLDSLEDPVTSDEIIKQEITLRLLSWAQHSCHKYVWGLK